jgi:hypothetical protein
MNNIHPVLGGDNLLIEIAPEAGYTR